jgi:hypothetical protein
MQLKTRSEKSFWKKLAPFFDFSIQSVEDLLSLLLGIFVLGVIVFQAATLELSYDEAYTYMNTGRIQDFWKMYQFRIANTHVLNSLLMTVTTLFTPYSDFAIRLPNVLSAACYLSIAIAFSKRFKHQLLIVGLLSLFYFQVSFMSLGRGYGIAAMFLLAALFVYHSKESFKRYHIWIAFLFVLAFYSNYVAIAPIAATAIFIFFYDYQRKFPEFKKKELRWLIGLFVVGLYGFFSVTLKGKPLYGAYEKGFFEAIPFEYLFLFLGGENPLTLGAVTVLSLAFLVAILVLFVLKKGIRFGIITILTFIIVALMAAVGDKPLPTGRVLIPFWPLLVLSIAELLELIPVKKKVSGYLLRVGNLGIFVLLIYNFLGQFQYQKYLVSSQSKWKIPITALANYQPLENPSNKYYIQKDICYNITPTRLQAYSSETIMDENGVSLALYPDLSLIEMKTGNLDPYESISGAVWKGDSLIYSSNFPFNELVYEGENEITRLFPLPVFEFDRIELVDGEMQLIYTIN